MRQAEERQRFTLLENVAEAEREKALAEKENADKQKLVTRVLLFFSAVTLLLGSVSLWAYLDARDSRDSALRANRQSNIVADYFVDTLGKADPGRGGEDFTVAEALDRASEQIQQDSVLEPLTRARLFHAIAEIYLELGLPKKALPLVRQARYLQEKNGAAEEIVLATLNDLGRALDSSGDLQNALRVYDDTLARRQMVLGREHPDTLQSMNNKALCLLDLGETATAIAQLETTLALRRRILGEHRDVFATQNNLALAYQADGRADEALPLFEECLRFDEKKNGRDHPDTLVSRNNYARAHRATGAYKDALTIFEENFRLSRQRLKDRHPLCILFMSNLAVNYDRDRQYERAFELGQEAKDLCDQNLDESAPTSACRYPRSREAAPTPGAFRGGNLALRRNTCTSYRYSRRGSSLHAHHDEQPRKSILRKW